MTHSLTIAAVTGHDGYTHGSLQSIIRSYEQLRPYINDLRCLLVSPTRPDSLPEYIQHIATQPFSYLEYNLFMVYSLGQLIKTDFCLVVQDDGFVLDGKYWRDEFFEYDYIGAPSPYSIYLKNGELVAGLGDQVAVFP